MALADKGLGALMVITNRDTISELLDGGIPLEAKLSREILESIFQKDSPLHDGAVIIEDDEISKANAFLPLTQRMDVPSYYGTRHRAAMGLAERCDALVLVVSEERAEISVMQGRETLRITDKAELFRLLDQLQSPPKKNLRIGIRRFFLSKLRLKLTAAGLAVLIWGITFVGTSTTVQTVSVPVQFSGVPAGMDVSDQSATRIEVQLRGSPILMDSGSIRNLVANFDLSGAQPGLINLRVSAEDLALPPGVVIERTSPKSLSVRLVRRGKL